MSRKSFTIEKLNEVVSSSTSYREVAEKLGYSKDGGGTILHLKQLVLQHGIDLSHFTGQSHRKNCGKIRTPTEDYLNNRVKVNSWKLKQRQLEDGIFEYRCCACGNDSWLGKPIPLELHHIDGDKQNNSLSNLEQRCPNCHYFTDTYKTKNIKKR